MIISAPFNTTVFGKGTQAIWHRSPQQKGALPVPTHSNQVWPATQYAEYNELPKAGNAAAKHVQTVTGKFMWYTLLITILGW